MSIETKEKLFRLFRGQNILGRFGWPGLLVRAEVKEEPFWLHNTYLELSKIQASEISIDGYTGADFISAGWVRITDE